MRIRTIKPEFWESESLSRVSREARLLFVGLFSCCDDHGRTRAHSRILASRLYPFDEDALSLLEGWLSELEAIGCIRRYMVDGETFLEIPKWLNHQKIDKPSKSKLPEYVPDSFTPREDSRGFAKNSLGTGIREQGSGNGIREQVSGMQGGCGKVREWNPNPTQLRLGSLFKRKPETRWSEKESKAFKAIGEIQESDLALIESYHAKSEYHRKDLLTLLNNWATELDRARNFKPTGHRPETNMIQETLIAKTL